ncbi:hypothetical protein D3C71_2064230 [compost metagenome]
MCYEAMERAERAMALKAVGKALMDEAEAEMQEAEALTNTRRETLASRMGF